MDINGRLVGTNQLLILAQNSHLFYLSDVTFYKKAPTWKDEAFCKISKLTESENYFFFFAVFLVVFFAATFFFGAAFFFAGIKNHLLQNKILKYTKILFICSNLIMEKPEINVKQNFPFKKVTLASI